MDDKNFKEDCREKFSKHKRVYQEFKSNRSNFDLPNASLISNLASEVEQAIAKSPSQFDFEDDEHH